MDDDDEEGSYCRIGHFCENCRQKYPFSLLKATQETGEYALKLRSGDVWLFTEAWMEGAFVHLIYEKDGHSCSVDVRADDIVWCISP